MKGNELTRRDFIKGAALTGAGLAVGGGLLTRLDALAQGKIYLPLILKSLEPTPEPPSPPTGSRVVHVHDSDATNWNGSGWYGDHVNQSVVDSMVDRGVMELTGTSTRANAWRALIPNYSGGTVAIKVNFNNEGRDNIIDALIHPVNTVIQGLTDIGVATEDILVFDATRHIPDHFKSGCAFTGVRFYSWDEADFTVPVTFSRPNIPEQYLASAVVDAAYLINMPIMKNHSITGVTLTFKNHFGTIHNCYALHEYVDLSPGNADYNPMVDIYLSPHIRDKTVLILGDGLFASKENTNTVPERWQTFGNEFPNSLFFATDPVAIDCVMYDLLNAEPYGVPEGADDLLRLAANAGLGTREHGDPWAQPWGAGYSQIDYVRIEA